MSTVEFWEIRDNPPELLGTITLTDTQPPRLLVAGNEWVHEIVGKPAFDVQPAPTEEYMTALEAAYQGTGVIARKVG